MSKIAIGVVVYKNSEGDLHKLFRSVLKQENVDLKDIKFFL